jgi:hypothetical protein
MPPFMVGSSQTTLGDPLPLPRYMSFLQGDFAKGQRTLPVSYVVRNFATGQ